MFMNQFQSAILLSVIITGLALWRGSLSKSGAAGGAVVGMLTFGLGGWHWGILLGVFFVSSSLLSHFKEAEKAAAAEKFEKGHKRDIGQVMANGGVGAVAAALSAAASADLWFAFFVGVMATVTADTWATELGTLSKRPPRLITTWQRVEVGSSGGVSALGTAVSLGGGLLIGLVSALLIGGQMLPFLIMGGLGGLLGSLFDSLLGATIQKIYFCDRCQKDTERKLHKCGAVTRPLRGWPWLNNDMVNLLASLIGGLVALAVWSLLVTSSGMS